MGEDGKMNTLDNLKARLTNIAEQIDDFDQRKADAKGSMVEASTRLEKAEVEAQSNDRRKRMLTSDLEESTRKVKEVEDQLAAVKTESDKIEEARQTLEDQEAEGDDKLIELEESTKESKRELEENESKLREAERKLVVVKRDLDKTKEKSDTMGKRVEILSGTIEVANKNLESLEEKEGESQDKETLNTEKISFLESQHKEAEVRREAASRSCNVLEMNILEIKQEIAVWDGKITAIETEFNDMDKITSDDEGGDAAEEEEE